MLMQSRWWSWISSVVVKSPPQNTEFLQNSKCFNNSQETVSVIDSKLFLSVRQLLLESYHHPVTKLLISWSVVLQGCMRLKQRWGEERTIQKKINVYNNILKLWYNFHAVQGILSGNVKNWYYLQRTLRDHGEATAAPDQNRKIFEYKLQTGWLT